LLLLQKIEILDSLVVFINTYTKVTDEPSLSPVNFEMAALVRSTNPYSPITVPVPLVIKGIASAIGNAIVASGNPTILSSATGLLSVLSPRLDGTFVQTTLAAYLATFGLKLKNVVPHMVATGLLVVVGTGCMTAFALPGTIMASATPSVKVCDVVSLRTMICDRAEQLAPLKLSAMGLDSDVIALMAQLKNLEFGAKLKTVLEGDAKKRFTIDGTLGSTTVMLTASPLKTVLDKMKIDECGVLASRVGKLEEVKALTICTSLKGLIGLISESYVLRIAIPNSPATIYRVAVPEA